MVANVELLMAYGLELQHRTFRISEAFLVRGRVRRLW